MSRAEQAIDGIRDAARQRREATEARTRATADLRRYCIEARDAGVPISQIAREAGLSRQGVYDLLGEQPGR
jgi:DNA invertase Pin-like site-specific DNA recombinase